jgi:hypothetical protein
MGIGYFKCPSSNVRSKLQLHYIGCRDRRFVGWPEDSEQCEEPLRAMSDWVDAIWKGLDQSSEVDPHSH